MENALFPLLVQYLPVSILGKPFGTPLFRLGRFGSLWASLWRPHGSCFGDESAPGLDFYCLVPFLNCVPKLKFALHLCNGSAECATLVPRTAVPWVTVPFAFSLLLCTLGARVPPRHPQSSGSPLALSFLLACF